MAAYKVYFIAVTFLLVSFLQSLGSEYLLNGNNVLFDNITASLVLLVIGLHFILLHRFVDCPSISIWMRCMFVLCGLEFTIIGSGRFVTKAPILELTACVMSLLLLLVIFSLVGAYLAKTDTVHFVGMLSLWALLSLIICVVILSFMLAIQWQVTYGNMIGMGIFPAILFCIAYDSRIINGQDTSTMAAAESLRYGLFLYGDFVLLLVVILNLMKSQRDY